MFQSDQHKPHISGQFNNELGTLKNDILAMGGLVESQLSLALNALLEKNTEKALQVIKRDNEVNALELKIDQECARILARRQPAASDLRLVLAVIKINMDLERVGDEAAKIARQAKVIVENSLLDSQFVNLRLMGKQIIDTLRLALDALARSDAQLALEIVAGDSSIDAVYAQAMEVVVKTMRADESIIPVMLNELWALKALERIGDHASNIGEHVIYMVSGHDVRHRSSAEISNQLESP
ncbi:MAG TPA: phosphate transport system regulatory protein PhoU [Halieaceae bacterium]|nr:phosphate transport system regulatory protein PhoU [Halieaceae bacterium]